jgi:hypothetical protein
MLANWFSTTYIRGGDCGREKTRICICSVLMKWPFGISNDDRGGRQCIRHKQKKKSCVNVSFDKNRFSLAFKLIAHHLIIFFNAREKRPSAKAINNNDELFSHLANEREKSAAKKKIAREIVCVMSQIENNGKRPVRLTCDNKSTARI